MNPTICHSRKGKTGDSKEKKKSVVSSGCCEDVLGRLSTKDFWGSNTILYDTTIPCHYVVITHRRYNTKSDA